MPTIGLFTTWPSGAGGSSATACAAGAPAAAPEPAPSEGHVVKSPMVVTFYRAATPGAKPFVEIGDQVEAGDTLVIIEAMKVMNPIAAPKAGTVKQIFVQDAQPVEYDTPLVVIE